MYMWKKGCLGLVLTAGLAQAVEAQIPLSPPSAGAATPLAAPPAAQPSTLWDFLGLSKTQRQACKEYLCKTQIGQLMNNGLKPLGALTGGLLGPCCPPFNTDDLNKPPDSAEGAAARIKQDEANAKARRAAVRYLGTVDCHYWPEAQDALIASLRTDRNECVRWEAAMVLGSGCCCTKATIKALALTVSSSEEDGNPAETSERVKAAAARSLAHCLSCAAVVQPLPLEDVPANERILPKPEPKPEPIPPGEKAPNGMTSLPAGPTGYYRQVRQMSMDQVVEDARKTQARAQAQAAQAAAQTAAAPAATPAPVIPKERTLLGVLRTAFSDPVPEKAAPPAAPKTTTEPPTAPKAGVPVSAAPPAMMLPPLAQGPMPLEYPGLPVTTPQAPIAAAPPVMPAPYPVPMPPMRQMSIPELVAMLRSSAYPDQREWAVQNLGTLDGQTNPEVVQVVLTAAVLDPAPMVRAACIRSLVSMNVNTWPVLTTVQALKNDSDPRVKQEADVALLHLVPGLSGSPEMAARR
jgi:hypothetical protein